MFKPFRLQYGIYGQRQPDVQMVRIRIPFGGMTANQLRQVADIADTYRHRGRACYNATGLPIALCAASPSWHHHAEIGRSWFDDT